MLYYMAQDLLVDLSPMRLLYWYMLLLLTSLWRNLALHTFPDNPFEVLKHICEEQQQQKEKYNVLKCESNTTLNSSIESEGTTALS